MLMLKLMLVLVIVLLIDKSRYAFSERPLSRWTDASRHMTPALEPVAQLVSSAAV